jgi:hypothetical protein
MEEHSTKNVLTGTNSFGTVGQEQMDATVTKLLNRLKQIEWERLRLGKERDGIYTALAVAGVRPPTDQAQWLPSHKENEYALRQPFSKMLLTEACVAVLKDYVDQWLSKTQVEFLLARGGYESEARDTKNSINVTLRRLAAEGRIEATHARGAHGNRYRYHRSENVVKD